MNARAIRPQLLAWCLAALLPASAEAAPPYTAHLAHDVSFDPATAALSGTSTMSITPEGAPLDVLWVLVDAGLAFTRVEPSVPARDASFLYDHWRALRVTFDPPLPAGTQAVVTLDYQGTLQCPEVNGRAYCDAVPGQVARLVQSSFAPLAYAATGGLAPTTQELTFRVPDGVEVIASAQRTSQAVEAGQSVTRWSRTGPVKAMLDVLVGMVESFSVDAAGVQVSFHHAPGDAAWDGRMEGWPARIVPFVEALGGRELPYGQVRMVKLAPYHRETGYTTDAMILLSEWHGSHLDSLFEEEWAHEFAHLFFGVVMSPEDAAQQWVTTEGVVVLAEWDYAFQHFHADQDREAYLARRSREAELFLRYVVPTAGFPPLVGADPAAGTAHWAWAYARAPATLDALRALVGDGAYQAALISFLDACAYETCDIGDFQQHLEAASGRDLDPFFQQWIYETHYPRLRVGFSQAPAAGGWEVEVRLSQQEASGTSEVELWLEPAEPGGATERRTVTLAGLEQTYRFPLPAPVRAVRPNPRQDALLWSGSAQDGDVDFDGALDGVDLVRCAWLHGRRVSADFQPGRDSLANLDLDFDPRCDVVEDGTIGDADLAQLESAFGSGVR